MILLKRISSRTSKILKKHYINTSINHNYERFFVENLQPKLRIAILAITIISLPIQSQPVSEWLLSAQTSIKNNIPSWVAANAPIILLTAISVSAALLIRELQKDSLKKSFWELDEDILQNSINDTSPHTKENSITINGENLCDIIPAGQNLICTPSIESDGILLKIKNRNIEIESFTFDDNEIEMAFYYLKRKEASYQSQQIEISSNSLSYNGASMNAKEFIFLQGKSNIDLSNMFLHAKKVIFAGNKMKFNHCFVNTNEIIIEALSPNSSIALIRIVFDKESDMPAGLHGSINLSKNEINDESPLLIFGIKKIDIQFAPHAF